jgi:hypothetical protein
MKAAAPRATGGISTAHAPSLDLPFRFLAPAILSLLGVAILYPWYLPSLAGAFYSADRIAFAHMNTLGWLAPIIVGAGYQLVPVVMQTHLPSVRLGRASWWIYWPSLLLFLAGWLVPWTPGIALGGTGVMVALHLYSLEVLATVRRSHRRDFIAWHVAVATLFLAAASVVGFSMAVARWIPAFGGANLPLLSAHVVLMLGGWVSLMVHGVAYRLVGMFTLSEDLVRPHLAWAGLACTALGSASLALAWPLGWWPLAAPGVLLLGAGAGTFSWQLARMYRGRRRRTFDVHMPFAITAALWELAVIAVVVWAVFAGAEIGSPLWKVAVWVALVGWAGTMEQGMLYKIGTFLTWLHRYAPMAGRQPVPRLDQLYSLPLAMAGYGFWTLGVLASALGIWGEARPMLFYSGLSLAAGAFCFVLNMAQIGAHWLRRSGPATASRTWG